jgi:hypothetical protein
MTDKSNEAKVVAPGFTWRGHEFGEFRRKSISTCTTNGWSLTVYPFNAEVSSFCESLDVRVLCEETKPGLLVYRAETTEQTPAVRSSWQTTPVAALDDMARKIYDRARRNRALLQAVSDVALGNPEPEE